MRSGPSSRRAASRCCQHRGRPSGRPIEPLMRATSTPRGPGVPLPRRSCRYARGSQAAFAVASRYHSGTAPDQVDIRPDDPTHRSDDVLKFRAIGIHPRSNPRFSGLRISRTAEYSRSSISAEPSADPLSTTIISKFCWVWVSRDFRQARSSSRRFQFTTMTETFNIIASAYVIIQLALW